MPSLRQMVNMAIRLNQEGMAMIKAVRLVVETHGQITEEKLLAIINKQIGENHE